MKLNLLTFLLVALAAGIDGSAPPAPYNSRLINHYSPFEPPSCVGKPTVSCAPDCLNLMYCGPSGDPVLVSCQKQTGHKFCENAECVDEIESCPGDSSKYCLEKDGQFPNVDNCKEFIQCVKGAAFHYQCQANTVYNQSAGYCQPGIPCYNYSPINGLCRNKDHMAIEYALDHKYYVLCTSTEPILFKCPGKEGDHNEFNPKKGTCGFMCSSMGLFVDPNDKHSYYECVKVGTTWQSTRRHCPGTQIFDDEEKRCVDDPATTIVGPATTTVKY